MFPGLAEHLGAQRRERGLEQHVARLRPGETRVPPAGGSSTPPTVWPNSTRAWNASSVGERAGRGEQLVAVAAEGRGDLVQDPLLLLAGARRRFRQGVVQLDHGERLDEHRRAGGGDVEDQAGDGRPVADRHGDAVALAPHRERRGELTMGAAERRRAPATIAWRLRSRAARAWASAGLAVSRTSPSGAEPLLAERQQRLEQRQGGGRAAPAGRPPGAARAPRRGSRRRSAPGDDAREVGQRPPEARGRRGASAASRPGKPQAARDRDEPLHLAGEQKSLRPLPG